MFEPGPLMSMTEQNTTTVFQEPDKDILRAGAKSNCSYCASKGFVLHEYGGVELVRVCQCVLRRVERMERKSQKPTPICKTYRRNPETGKFEVAKLLFLDPKKDEVVG